MPKSKRKVKQHRSLFISDAHLGSPAAKARLLADFLKHNECEQLFLVGDIFDGWKMKEHFHWTADHSRVIKAVIAKARRGTRVYYVMGNHDGFMRQFVRSQLRLGKIRITNEHVHTTADGRRLLVLHGDAFDDIVTQFPRLAFVADMAYESLIRASDRLNSLRQRFHRAPWPISAFMKTQVKAVVQWWSGFDEKVVQRCQDEHLDGVICGHTHHAEAREICLGITSYNCGDWVESCTALTEDFKGNIKVVQLAAGVSVEPVLTAGNTATPALPQRPANPARKRPQKTPFIEPGNLRRRTQRLGRHLGHRASVLLSRAADVHW